MRTARKEGGRGGRFPALGRKEKTQGPTRGADTSDAFLELASPAPPAAVAPPPAAPPPPPVLEIQEAGLYPVPELGAPATLFGRELPFGIQPMAFLITSAVAVFLTLLFGYLFFLTATH